LPYNQSYSLVYKRGFEIDVLGGWNIISFPVTLYGNRNTVMIDAIMIEIKQRYIKTKGILHKQEGCKK